MSAPAQTPASRRFLPPSSTSKTGSQSVSSSSRRSRFPKSTQPSSSSPFARTPFPNRTLRQDDIETSFEEEYGEPQLPLNQPSSVLKTVSRTPGSVKDDTNRPPSEALEALDDTLGSNEIADGDLYSSPLPKRQKISHHRTVPDPIPISSSPSAEEDLASDLEHDHQGESGDDIAMNDDEDVSVSTGEDRQTNSKFKTPATVQSTQQETHARIGFRPVFQNMSTDRTSMMHEALPNAFSPSKRQGKKDYVYGGAAETVRGWILDVANEESRSGRLPEETMDVMPVSSDPNGRFKLVKDGQDQVWMLTSQQDSGKPSRSTTDGDAEQGTVLLKGNATRWDVRIHDKHSTPNQPTSIKVAVLWKSVS